MHKQRIVYGLICDFMNVIKYAIVRKPSYRSYIESKPFMNWYLTVLDFVIKRVRQRVGIPDLDLQSVWIGSGSCATCWILPDRFTPRHITDTDARRLEKLKLYLGDPKLSPSFFYEFSDEERKSALHYMWTNIELYFLSLGNRLFIYFHSFIVSSIEKTGGLIVIIHQRRNNLKNCVGID